MLNIITYPDPILRRRAEEIEEINDAVREVVARMLETMYAGHGVGLAAPQVGISKRIVVFNPTGEAADERVLINPKLVEHRGAMEGEEGCLSFPEVYGMIRRSSHVKILAYDLDGNDLEVTATDFLARVLQHEVDHVDGTLFIDRMTAESRVRVREALKALEESFGRGPEEGGGKS